jgi:hypothetical protein
MDTSDVDNHRKIDTRCQQYRDALDPLDQPDQEFWLALHQPLWLRNMDGWQDDGSKFAGVPCKETGSAITAIREKFEARKDRLARVTIGGDTHAFQFFWPKTASTPIQIVAGNGGTQLDDFYKILPPGEKRPGKRKDNDKDKIDRLDPDVRSFGIEGSSRTLIQHGFTVMRRNGLIWTATQFDSGGSDVLACRFSEALSPGLSDPLGCGDPPR